MAVVEIKPGDSDRPPPSDRSARSFYVTACLSGWAWPRDIPGFESGIFPLEQLTVLEDLLRGAEEIGRSPRVEAASRDLVESPFTPPLGAEGSLQNV